MDKELFFEEVFINSTVKSKLDVTSEEYSRFVEELYKERKEEIELIKRVRTLYHNKKKMEGYGFEGKDTDKAFSFFYKWFKKQYKEQKGACYYCKTEETVLKSFAEDSNSKRITRGRHLEIERRDSAGSNIYNEDNCVLACYFCNNDKSDFFSEQDYLEYLKDRKSFFDKKYAEKSLNK